MKLFGVQLRSPGLADIPMAAIILILGLAFCGLALFLEWNIAQIGSILFGSAAAAITTACGVHIGSHGVRGLLVGVVILVALVMTTVGIHRLFS